MLTDLKPLYLLHMVTKSTEGQLPHGVEILYDDDASTHAYRFTERASSLGFPAAVFFKNCDYFPEEFSILVTFKVGPKTSRNDECLFSMIPTGTTDIKVGVRLYKGRLQVDYYDRTTKRRRVTQFRQRKLFDKDWHTLAISITGNRVVLRTDCGKRKTKRLRRAFPSFLSTRGASIHVGNCNQNRGIFSVSSTCSFY